MLRRISTILASVAMIGLCALPASAATTAAHASSHNFSVPTMKSHNIVTGWGSYQKINSLRVKIHICARQTGSQFAGGGPTFAVGAVAVVSNSRGATKNVGGVIINGHRGSTNCATLTFTFYSAHLKVYTFAGNMGRILAKSTAKKIY